MVGFFQILAGLKDLHRHLEYSSFQDEYGVHLKEHLQKKGVKPRSIVFRGIATVTLLVVSLYCQGFWLHVLAVAAIVIQTITIIADINAALQAMVLADHQTMKILRDKYNKSLTSTPRRRS